MPQPWIAELEKSWLAAGPDAIAVVEEDRSVTWASLANAARLLDGALGQIADPSSGPYVIDCGRSAEAIVAVVACLMRGSAFVLVDDDIPARRLDWLCADCGAHAVVRRREDEDTRASSPPKPLPLAVVSLDPPGQDAGEARRDTDAWIHRGVSRASDDPERELYRVYTSGSTGRPKGASVPARSIDGLLPALMAHVPELSVARCIGLTASFGFDAALQQIFLALSTATPLAIPRAKTVRTVDALMTFWAAATVDVADGTPTLLRMLAAAPRSSGRALSPRVLLIGGDVMRPSDLAAFWSRFDPEIAVVNLYGVAECGIDATAHRVTQADALSAVVPVGRALDHCAVFVADEDGARTKLGVSGEVYIRGSAVGNGYPARADETAARFLELDEGGCAYRTGDRGREQPDGSIVIEGRLDRQVKIGGRRVEPAEIESLVVEWAQHAAGRVITRLGSNTVQRCSRCVVSSAHPDAEIDATGLCRFCRTVTEDIAVGWGHFRTSDDLRQLLSDARRRRSGGYDAILLFSGGKDSTYALYRLRELGAKFLAFTFDNGFISASAFENIRRILGQTGTEHRVLQARDNGGLLAESIRADATVCTGCFRGITTLGVQLALDTGSPLVISGLSRGQIIETKLMQFLRRGRLDLSAIDDELESHLRLYLARRDAQADAVGTFSEPELASRVKPVDYFRYDSASSAEVLDFLGQHDPAWAVPADTGVCSSNCRANDVGITEHIARLGYHNYESPLSWEVRLGMISREEALEQVTIPPQGDGVTEVRQELARRCDAAVVQDDHGRLVGALQAGGLRHTVGLRRWLRQRVPEYMVPAQVQIVAELPRLANGKVDYHSVLRVLSDGDARGSTQQFAPADDVERRVEVAWTSVLGRPPTGRDSDFFRDGGDSLAATEFAAALEEEFGCAITITLVFEAPTLSGTADVVRQLIERATPSTASSPEDTSDVTLRSVLVTDDSVDPDVTTVVLMPDLLGRIGPLVRIFAALGADRGWDVIAVEFAAPAAWGANPSLRALADAIARVIAHEPRAGTHLIVGWSFGAILAEHVACALAGQPGPTVHSPGRAVNAWLLDPPADLAAQVDEIRVEVASSLLASLPQFSSVLTTQAAWADITAVIDRARRYRGGGRRLLEALPRSAQNLVRGGVSRMDDEQLGVSLVNMAIALASLAGTDDSTSDPLADAVQWLVVRPSKTARAGTGVHDPRHRLATVREISNADHDSMIDIGHLPFYLRLADAVACRPYAR